MALARLLHVFGIVVWVGGMFFAYLALRPAAAQELEPPQRLRLWRRVLQRFFSWVWFAVALILASGWYMMWQLSNASVPWYAYAMMGTGLLMMLIFVHVFFAPFRRLRLSVAAQDWNSAGNALNQIRILVAANLILGLVNIAVATLGPAIGV
ncbi:MAG TPA: CopD family protein [Burkholderiales bacterium]|nr:CopD family protein [Burkholderiales bacterium]